MSSASTRPPSILHLEDDSNDAALICLHLARSQFQCGLRWVKTREEFVEALAAGMFDLVISDYRMPGFTGEDALHYIKEHHPQIPFIMLTGELGEDRAVETIKRGATDYVLKGNLARLVPSIKRAIREASVEAEKKRVEAELREVKEQLARELRDMERLHELSSHLLSDRDPEQTLRRVLDACIELVGADKGTLQLWDSEARSLSLRAQKGFGEKFQSQYAYVPVGHDCTCGRAIEARERVMTEDVLTDESVSGMREIYELEGLRACVSTPLFARDGATLGMLSTHFARPHRPSPHTLRLLDLYVQQAARALEGMQEPA